jgi:hypothetical protein
MPSRGGCRPGSHRGCTRCFTLTKPFFLLCSAFVLLRLSLLPSFTMASNDDWIAAFQGTTLQESPSTTLTSGGTVLSSGTLVSTPTIASSAPSIALAGGSSGEYGGVAKRAHLFSFDPSVLLCCGFVGNAGLRFCIKPVLEVKHEGDETPLTCGVGKHVKKFQPDPDCFYLRGNDSTAYCHPAFPQDQLPPEIRAQTKTMKKTNQEWKDLFARHEDSNAAVTAAAGKLVFKTPKKFLLESEGDIPAVFNPKQITLNRDYLPSNGNLRVRRKIRQQQLRRP